MSTFHILSSSTTPALPSFMAPLLTHFSPLQGEFEWVHMNMQDLFLQLIHLCQSRLFFFCISKKQMKLFKEYSNTEN